MATIVKMGTTLQGSVIISLIIYSKTEKSTHYVLKILVLMLFNSLLVFCATNTKSDFMKHIQGLVGFFLFYFIVIIKEMVGFYKRKNSSPITKGLHICEAFVWIFLEIDI